MTNPLLLTPGPVQVPREVLEAGAAPMKGVVTGRDAAWTTVDRCDGTLTTVQRGRVSIKHGRRTVSVRAGHRYLIRARLFAARARG